MLFRRCKPFPPQTRDGKPLPKVRLTGRVGGVVACELLTVADEITVGAGVDCDLVLLDPLAAPKAFRLLHLKEHDDPKHVCHACWEIQVFPGARVYVNNSLTRRERVAFGDTVTVGCHVITFQDGELEQRDSLAHRNVNDLCAALIDAQPPPIGFLRGCVGWRDRARTRAAQKFGAGVAALLALIAVIFWPRDKMFDAIQPPMEITMLAAHTAVVPPDAVKGLAQVERKVIETAAEQPPTPPELQPVENETVSEMNAEPVATETLAAPPQPPELQRAVTDAGPMLAPLAVAGAENSKLVLKRETAALGRSAPLRRLSISEAAQAAQPPQELGVLQAKIDRGPVAARTSTVYAAELTRRQTPAPAANLDNRAEVLAQLKYEATAIKSFEDYRGMKIPVARVPQQLASLEVGPDPTAQPVQLDGQVSEQEIAVSFKTGRFTIHAPGTPPAADPPTYCYVAKVQENGKDHLYISFDCKDPQLSGLVLNHGDGTANLAKDDSIEVFLDLNGDRADYHQLIVNARGNLFATYCRTGDEGINGRGAAWDAGVKTKTTINPNAGNWVCEILIPYDRLPAAPARGTKIPVNFCRNFRGQSGNLNHLQNWFSVWTGDMSNYHHPSKFGLLEWP